MRGVGERSTAAWLVGLVLAAAMAVYLESVVLVAHPASSRLGMVLLFGALYACLAVTLVAGLMAATRIAWPLGLAAAVGVAAVLVWHFRENFEAPLAIEAFAAWVVGVGAALFLIGVGRFERRASPVGPLLVGVGALGLLMAGLVATFEAQDSVRWHLLRHNKLLGTPTYYALAEPIESIREGLWESRATEAPPPPAPFSPAEWGPPQGAPPNLVFVLVDTLRADALSAYGGPPDLMPELNAFAAESWVFRNVLANATWTRPSVASLFTGLLPEEHGAVDRGDALPTERTTLAEMLAERGYATAAFVSNYGAAGRSSGFAQGFQEFHEIMEPVRSKARAEQVNREVADWLGRRGASGGAHSPTFLYVHYLDPHAPYLSGGPTNPRSHRVRRESYFAELRYFDRHLPRLFELLDGHLAGPTFVFLISDHGDEFGEHGEGGHGLSLYPEVLHLPALLRTPGRDAGEIASALEERDFFDLLLRLAASPDLDVRAWAGERQRSLRYASIYGTTPLSSFQRPYLREVVMRAVEQDGAMAIWSAYGPTYELYDLARDPGARSNLADRDAPRLERLRRTLDELPAHWSRPVPVGSLPAANEEQLRALGYIE